MEANEETYRLFDNYLSGNLSGAEKELFEKRLSEDQSFNEEFIWMSSAVNSIRMSGNQIFKKQIAEIGKGIPATAFDKYSPSIKPKNFFRKYWWAVAAASSIVIALGCLYVITHKQHAKEDLLEDYVAPIDSMNKKDSVATPIDSAAADSAKASSIFGSGEQPAFCPDGDCNSFEMVIFSETTSSAYVWGSDVSGLADTPVHSRHPTISTSAGTIEDKINVEFCRQTSQAPFYSFSGDLTICSTYSDSTKIRFHQTANGSLIMTDGKPGYFTLVPGTGIKKLVRENGSGKKENEKPNSKVIKKEPTKPKPVSKIAYGRG